MNGTTTMTKSPKTTMQATTQTGTPSPETTKKLNGFDLPALQQAMAAVKADPANAMTHWKVTSHWQTGTRSDHVVDGFEIAGRQVDRQFTLRIDEPHELTGTNQYANPQEYLLAAMNACMMVGYVAVASMMGIELTKLELETTGEIDLRGFLGISRKVPPGYEELHYTVRIAGNGTPEQFQMIHETVQATSPNYWNIAHAIRLTSDLVVE